MKVLEEGLNPIFMDPDPDKARRVFAKKSRRMTDKRMSAREAVDKFIPDGSYVAVGGYGTVRIPTLILHEILRFRRKNLGFLGLASSHDFQLMCAGNCLNRVDCASIIGFDRRYLSPNAKRVIESGDVQLCEWTSYALTVRLKAASEGVSFGLVRSMLGTDTFKMSGAKRIECPFTGKRFAAVPALWPDVAVIHVHSADIYGNCHIRGATVSDLELVRAAKVVVMTTERLVDHEVIRNSPSRTSIPYYLVDAVTEVPFGSYPGNMPYLYAADEDHLAHWINAEQDPEGFRSFLERYIFGVSSFEEYLELCGGSKRLRELKRREAL